jgi:hypothetical protein
MIAASKPGIAEAAGEIGMVTLAPAGRRQREAGRRLGRPGAAVHLEGIAAHEAARPIGFVEFLRDQDIAERSLPGRRDAVVEEAGDHRVGVEHQVAADQAAGIGKAVGVALGRRQQQQARRADAVGRQDHRAGRLEPHRAVAVEVACPGGAAVRSR